MRMIFNTIAVISISFIVGCVTCPEHCSVCNSTEHCFLCDNGYYGANCTTLCANCASDTTCTRDVGICEGACKDGLSGPYCDKPCDTRCFSCLRNETTKCLTYKYNQTYVDVCPNDCVSQICKENLCSNGCLPGYWGLACSHTCPEPCKTGFNRMRRSNVHTVDGVNVVVPVISVLLVTLLGVVFSMLFWRRRWMRHRDSHVVLHRPEHIAMRPIDLGNVSGNFGEASERTELQNNTDKFPGNLDPSYFSSLSTGYDLPKHYTSLDESACTGTDNCDYQNKPTTKASYTTDETAEIHQEELQGLDYHHSDTVNAYITPTE